MRHHVITPLARIQNFTKLREMLINQQVQWHVITDVGATEIECDDPWIDTYRFKNPETTFWGRCNAAVNWYLDHKILNQRDRYCILNDDDAYEPDFFKKLANVGDEVVAVSMKRGNRTPGDAIPERAHGTNTLIADPSQMKVGYVGVEQLLVSGRILSKCRLPIHICGDGQMIEYIVATNPVFYMPDAFVWFNYFEPGRWD